MCARAVLIKREQHNAIDLHGRMQKGRGRRPMSSDSRDDRNLKNSEEQKEDSVPFIDIDEVVDMENRHRRTLKEKLAEDERGRKTHKSSRSHSDRHHRELPDLPDQSPEDRHTAGSTGIRQPRRRKIGIHALFALVIAGILVFVAVRLYIWNIGEKSTYDPSKKTDQYDVEVQDVILAQNPDDLEGHTDDGKTTIVFLGNDLITDDTTETGIAGQVASLSGADCIAAGFPSSQIACYNMEYKTDSQHDMDDIFNFFYVANSISIDDFSGQKNVAAYHTDDERFAQTADTLAGIDWDSVDILVIAYDAADYLNGSAVWNDGNDVDLVTYTGALRLGIRRIHEAYPFIRIVFMSPTYTRVEQNGTLENGDTTNIGNGEMSTYWLKAVDVCVAEQVSFIDNYYGSINGTNYEQFMTDGVHLNNAGRTAIAKHFVNKIIEGDTSEYDFNTEQGADADSASAAAEAGTSE